MCGLHLRCSTPKQTQAIQDDTLLFLLLLLLAKCQESHLSATACPRSMSRSCGRSSTTLSSQANASDSL